MVQQSKIFVTKIPNPIYAPSNYQRLCDELQKYEDEERLVYQIDRHCEIEYCFKDREPKCSDFGFKSVKKFNEDGSECIGQWNVDVNFVKYEDNKCLGIES